MSTDPFVAQLANLCRSEPTRAKWVIVPTHAVGRTLGERLALEGADWANLRFATPFSLALDTAAPRSSTKASTRCPTDWARAW